MAIIKVRGHEINNYSSRDSFNRRALLLRNNIINSLKRIGLTERDIAVSHEVHALKKAQAYALWFMDGYRLYFSYNSPSTMFLENLYVVSRVIELEVDNLLDNKKTFEEFIREFTEDKNIDKKRIEARETLGLSRNIMDIELINKKYKILAKEHHPDMPTGSTEKFKTINDAYKTLKRELE